MLDRTHDWTAVESGAIAVMFLMGVGAIRLATSIASTTGSAD